MWRSSATDSGGTASPRRRRYCGTSPRPSHRSEGGGMMKLTRPCFVGLVLVAFGHIVAAEQRGAAQPQGAREVTVAGIPGVVAAGAKWTLAWQGTDNADGIVGTDDGGLLFAQEQPSQVSKLDK